MRRITTVVPLLMAPPAQAQTVPDAPKPHPTVLVGGVSGGLLAREGGADSPYATLSLTAYRDRRYLRGAVTWYRSTLRQPDAALPSTFVIGSLGAGGNWRGWVLDAYVSFGRQHFGQIVTTQGARDSLAGSTAPFYAGGLRAGRSFALGKRSWLTASGNVSAVSSRSLRHTIDAGRPVDLQIPDHAVAGSAALRIDRKIGNGDHLWLGLSGEHFVSSNGSTVLARNNAAASFAAITDRFTASPTPDGWNELGVSGSARLGKRLWLDLETKQSLGAVAGSTNTITLGIRFVL